MTVQKIYFYTLLASSLTISLAFAPEETKQIEKSAEEKETQSASEEEKEQEEQEKERQNEEELKRASEQDTSQSSNNKEQSEKKPQSTTDILNNSEKDARITMPSFIDSVHHEKTIKEFKKEYRISDQTASQISGLLLDARYKKADRAKVQELMKDVITKEVQNIQDRGASWKSEAEKLQNAFLDKDGNLNETMIKQLDQAEKRGPLGIKDLFKNQEGKLSAKMIGEIFKEVGRRAASLTKKAFTTKKGLAALTIGAGFALAPVTGGLSAAIGLGAAGSGFIINKVMKK